MFAGRRTGVLSCLRRQSDGIDTDSIGRQEGSGVVKKRKVPARRSAGAGRRRVAFEDLTVGDRENMMLEEVANLLQDGYVTRLPVVRDQQFVGIVAEGTCCTGI